MGYVDSYRLQAGNDDDNDVMGVTRAEYRCYTIQGSVFLTNCVFLYITDNKEV